MWLKTVKLENIKCFIDTTLDFSRPHGSSATPAPCRWITLLGENGVGKSTVLQSIALLLAGPEAAKELLSRPTGWLRDQSKPGKLTAEIFQEPEDEGHYGKPEAPWNRRKFSYSYYMTGDHEVQVPLRGRRDKKEETYTEPTIIEDSTNILSWLRVNAFPSDTKGWFAAGYGPFRRLDRRSRTNVPVKVVRKRPDSFITQFDEDRPLNAFEEWMVHLDYLQARDPKDENVQRTRAISEQAVNRLLPGKTKIAGVTKEGRVNFEINEQLVPSMGLSDGFRSVIAMAGDLIWGLLQSFPHVEDPTKAPGVVLIDELDIHLHPTWQRDIAVWLRETFPNLQFIVATHSPFVALGAGEDALTIRFELNEEKGDVSVDPVQDIFFYDVDQVLRSPAFEMVSTHSPQIQAKIEEYHRLRMKLETDDQMTDEDRALLDRLGELMRRMPLGSVPPEPGSLEDRIMRFLDRELPK